MKDSKLYLIHIRDCLQWIEDYTQEGKNDFFVSLPPQASFL